MKLRKLFIELNERNVRNLLAGLSEMYMTRVEQGYI